MFKSYTGRQGLVHFCVGTNFRLRNSGPALASLISRDIAHLLPFTRTCRTPCPLAHPPLQCILWTHCSGAKLLEPSVEPVWVVPLNSRVASDQSTAEGFRTHNQKIIQNRIHKAATLWSEIFVTALIREAARHCTTALLNTLVYIVLSMGPSSPHSCSRLCTL